MPEPIALPAMLEAQEQAWHALMDLHERIDTGWTLIGGQLVHLHCAERGTFPVRATIDADTVVDVRASPEMLGSFTGALSEMGFTTEISAEGIQHRWRRDLAQIDVLIPEGIGERAAARHGAGGAPTLSAPGTTQALRRTEPVRVQVGDRVGTVPRPNLVGALVAKAAARTEVIADRARSRHCADFVVLASLLAAGDFRASPADKKDRQRLRKMVAACRADTAAMAVEDAGIALARLERAAGLNG